MIFIGPRMIVSSVSTDPLGFAFAPVGRFRCVSIVSLIPADAGNVTNYFGDERADALPDVAFHPCANLRLFDVQLFFLRAMEAAAENSLTRIVTSVCRPL
jgi:hypothetical protein